MWRKSLLVAKKPITHLCDFIIFRGEETVKEKAVEKFLRNIFAPVCLKKSVTILHNKG